MFLYTNVTTTNTSLEEEQKSCEHLDFVFNHAERNIISLTDTIACVVNGLFSVLASVANLLVLYALLKASSLHLPSKALLFSLALSDFGIGAIVQPLFVAYRWAKINENLPDLCVAGIISHVEGSHFSAVSFLTMTAISVDRLFALLLRVRYHTVVTLKRAIVVLVSIWIGGGVWASSWAFNQRIYSFVTIFVIPICFGVTVFSYFKIYLCLRRQAYQMMLRSKPTSSVTCSSETSVSRTRYRKSVVSMFYLFCAFLLSYLPYLSHKVLVGILRWRTSTSVLFSLALTLVYLNSSINPVIYCYRISEVKQIVLEILRRMWTHIVTFAAFCKSNRQIEPTGNTVKTT